MYDYKSTTTGYCEALGQYASKCFVANVYYLSQNHKDRCLTVILITITDWPVVYNRPHHGYYTLTIGKKQAIKNVGQNVKSEECLEETRAC